MKPKIKSKQLISILNLLSGLKEFEAKGYGRITNLVTMINFAMQGDVFVRYEKDFLKDGQRDYEFKIAKIDSHGFVTFIDEQFKDVFQRYAFLGECKAFDIENPNEYEKID